MADLIIGAVLVSVASIVVFLATVRLAKRLHRSVSLLALLAGSAALWAYLELGLDSPRVVDYLPFSNAMILGNLAPEIGGVLAGVAYGALTGPWWRRGFVPSLMIGVACYLAARPIFAVQPTSAARLYDSVWRQTDQASCSPAAAATFLNDHGIPASEAEMSELCRTTNQGTSMLGLYRGLLLKTRGTPWKVSPITARTAAELREAATSRLIITTGLELDAIVDSRYSTDWGWAPGTLHTVVVRGLVGERFAIADPATGREQWPERAMEVLYRGEGFRLDRAE